MRFHPHLHCVVTGGGLSLDGQRWVAGQRHYFLPVKVLGKLFRGKFLAALKAMYQAGQLTLTGSVAPLNDPHAFQQLLEALYGRKWIVYAKRPFGGAQQVFRYLGRYSHRVAISNSRLLSVDNDQVSFQWKDYADGHQTKVKCLPAEEFLRRFLMHVLPKGFVRIRHYGLLASVNVATKLLRCRQLLGQECSPRNPQVRVGSTASWSGPAKIRCVVRFAKACWREARWRKRHLRRALQHPCRHRFGAPRLPTRIPPDPHGEGIGKVMLALAVKGAIIPTVRSGAGH